MLPIRCILTKTGTIWTETSGTGTQLAEVALPKIYIFNQSGLCTNQSSFTITIVNDLNTITPVSSSYCSAYELPFTLWQVFHPKRRNKYSWKYRTCSWNLNKHSWNTIYVWFEDTTVTPTCTREKFLLSQLFLFSLPKYTNQFSCTSYTLPTNSNGGVYYSNPNKGLPIIPPGTSITATKSIYVFKKLELHQKTVLLNRPSSYMLIWQVLVLHQMWTLVPPTLPALIVGEYRTAPSGGGLLVPEKPQSTLRQRSGIMSPDKAVQTTSSLLLPST
jgi:hypothetical protein